MEFDQVGSHGTCNAELVSPATQAARADVGQEAGSLSGFTSAEIEDLQLLSKSKGVAVTELAARFSGLSEFYQIVDPLRAAVNDGLVEARWLNGRGLLVVASSLKEQANRLVALHPEVSVDVTVSDVPGERQQDAIAEVLIQQVAKDINGQVTVKYDAPSGQAWVRIPANAIASSAMREQWATIVRSQVAGRTAVVVEVGDGEQPTPAARGGLAYSSCTGGFMVKTGSSRGISTAHHCSSKPSSYDGSSTGTTYPYSSRDVRWTKITSGTASAQFVYDRTGSSGTSLFRTATSSGNPVVGAYVCKFGKTTGSSCDYVEDSGRCVNYAGWPEFCGLFYTQGHSVQLGDSGGPWYSGNKALGITSGYDGGGDYFSGIGSLNLLGVTVVTG